MAGSNERAATEVLKSRHLSLEDTKPYYISDTSAHTDLEGYAMQAIADATFTTLVTPNVDGNDPAGMTLTAGNIIYIKVQDVTLTAGAVMIYRKKK